MRFSVRVSDASGRVFVRNDHLDSKNVEKMWEALASPFGRGGMMDLFRELDLGGRGELVAGIEILQLYLQLEEIGAAVETGGDGA